MILFHLDVPWLRGGFLGVDVFFVISGFLITSIIQSDLRQGTFSLRRFWSRRVRRIFPALLVVSACTLWAFMVLGFLPEQQAVGTQALAALSTTSNLYFWWTASDYWGGAAESAPFLHAWSLAVEEQFYLLFPIAVWLIHRARPAWVLPFIVAGGLLSLMAYWSCHETAPVATFYLAPFRAWELAAGCALACTPPRLLRRVEHRGALAAAGLALILGCFVAFEDLGAGPVLATCGTLAVLAAGRSGPARTVLCASPLVHIGRLSYSLYLWHWPLIVLAGELGFDWVGPSDKVALLVLMGLLAYASYRWVETPARRAERGPSVILLAAVIPAAAAVLMASQLRIYDASAYEEVEFISYSPHPAWAPATGPRVLGARMSNPGHGPDALDRGGIRVGPQWGPTRMVVIGDSHAEMWSDAIASIARSERIPTAFFSQAGEPWWTEGYDHSASEVFRWLERYRPEVIVVALAWRTIEPDGMRPILDLARSIGARVLLVEDPPWLRPCGNRSASQWMASQGIEPRDAERSYLNFDEEGPDGPGRALVRQLAGENDHVRLVRTFEAYASPEGFLILDGRTPVYLDDDHLSSHGAGLARPQLRTSVLRALAHP